MKNSTSLKVCAMALCLLVTQSMSATDIPLTKSSVLANLAKFELKNLVTTPQGLASSAFAISLFIFFSREPDGAPNRYNIEDVKQNPTFKTIFKFVYYFLLDGVIGHQRKSSSIKVDADGKTIEARPGHAPRGLYGNIADVLKPLGQTLGFVKDTGEFVAKCLAGVVAWELLVVAEQKA
jgi:hypothetical protein